MLVHEIAISKRRLHWICEMLQMNKHKIFDVPFQTMQGCVRPQSSEISSLIIQNNVPVFFRECSFMSFF